MKDFDGDAGPPPMSTATYREIETAILEAIDAHRCTGLQIKRFLSPVSVDDVSDVLTGMELERKIVRVERGQYSGYFRPSRIPSKFWVKGDGTCGLEFDGKEAVARAPRRIESRGSKWTGKTNSDLFPQKPELKGENINRRNLVKRKPIDYALLEEMIAIGATQVKVAAAFGITQPTFHNRMKSDEEFRAAVARGKQKLAEQAQTV